MALTHRFQLQEQIVCKMLFDIPTSLMPLSIYPASEIVQCMLLADHQLPTIQAGHA